MVSNKLRLKYPDKVPVLVTRSKKCKNLKDIGDVKYLIQDYITVGQFIYILRKRIEIKQDEALYLYAIDGKTKNEYVLSGNLEMISVYNEYKNDTDSILHIIYAGESVFG